LCDVCGLVAASTGKLADRDPPIASPCWPDRAAAELFWAQCEGDHNQGVLDFPRFFWRIVLPVGDALIEDPSKSPLEAFIDRITGSASQQSIGVSPRGRPCSEEEECENSW
jgi:hypothetical protein